MSAGLRCMRAGLILGWLMACSLAWAGQTCELTPPTVATVTQGLNLAARTVAALERSGARVAVVARAGQDLDRYGIRYSHVGLFYRGADGWRVVHKLNACGSAEAGVYLQGPGDFFLDQPRDYVAAIVALKPSAQDRVLPWLERNDAAARRQLLALHHRPYSMVAYPWADTFQQSNQWVLESLAAALGDGVHDRRTAQAWLQGQGFEPTEVRLSTLTRLGARVSMAHVSFDDHPMGLRMAGRIRTVTADGLMRWLVARDVGQPMIEVR